MQSLLHKLRHVKVEERIGPLKKEADASTLEQFIDSGVKFVISADSAPQLEAVFYKAIEKLLDCVKPNGRGDSILQEGGVYDGCWLESTGTINAELLSRFVPAVAGATLAQFARLQRDDGLIPYKITAAGEPVFRQIQLVTPLMRSAWHYYKLNGEDDDFLELMYEAVERYDAWLAKYRNTRGTGCVEAFCTFDTGHDLSARFWHVPDTPYGGDARYYDPNSPVLPFVAPDLTAAVYCSRRYAGLVAEKLGKGADVDAWIEKAEQMQRDLLAHCYDEVDQCFYDVDRHGQFVRVQSDVLLRVLACEVGDGALFAQMLRQYLLNTRKFFAKYPLTSIALDDPRFDPHASYNTWSGATNWLTLIRTPHAFEHHQRYVELSWIMNPIINAMARFERFGQVLSPWTGEEGYTESYSPAILGVLDFIERSCGILPRPDGDVWITALLPTALDHGAALANGTGYSRVIDGQLFELVIGSAADGKGDGEVAGKVADEVTGEVAGEVSARVNDDVHAGVKSHVHGGVSTQSSSDAGLKFSFPGAEPPLPEQAKFAELYIDGQLAYRFPEGLRLVTDRHGVLQAIIGMTARTVEGEVNVDVAGERRSYPVRIGGNEIWTVSDDGLKLVAKQGIVYPTY